MIATRVVVSLMHFFLMVLMSGFVIFWTYRTFIKANPDFDMEKKIKEGNIADLSNEQFGFGTLESGQSGERELSAYLVGDNGAIKTARAVLT